MSRSCATYGIEEL